jgi:hypothetical protein
MTWVALRGQWTEDDSEPESIYWYRFFDDWESAKRAMLEYIGEFLAYETASDNPCPDCVSAAEEELASLTGATVSRGWWRGCIDGDDYVITDRLDDAVVTAAAQTRGAAFAIWTPFTSS